MTGCKGQLGQALLSLQSTTYVELLGVSHTELDITDKFQIDAVFKKIKPDLLINTAAFTAVDKAESDSRLAFITNCEGPRYLAEACTKLGFLLFIYQPTMYLMVNWTAHIANPMFHILLMFMAKASWLVNAQCSRQRSVT